MEPREKDMRVRRGKIGGNNIIHKIMIYTTILQPLTLKFQEMSRKELKNYFEWFQDISPQRGGNWKRR